MAPGLEKPGPLTYLPLSESLVPRYGHGCVAGPFVRAAPQNQPARRDYLPVQRIYRGWAWLGMVVVWALASTPVLTVMVGTDRSPQERRRVAKICPTH